MIPVLSLPPRQWKTFTDLRVEWVKSLARAERWEEKVSLLRVEMSRSLKFLDHKAAKWLLNTSYRTDVPPDIRSGIMGYARKQSYFYRSLAKKFAVQWEAVLKSCKVPLPAAWPAKY